MTKRIMQRISALMFAVAVLMLPASAVSAQLPTRPYLPLDTAVALVTHAVAACAENGYEVTATVVGPAGVTKAMHRADGAGPHTIYSSSRKAFTAASLGVPTAELARIAAKHPMAAGLRGMGPRILILAGGLPIKVNGTLVGAIGVGGSPGGDLDAACARVAIKAVMGMPQAQHGAEGQGK